MKYTYIFSLIHRINLVDCTIANYSITIQNLTRQLSPGEKKKINKKIKTLLTLVLNRIQYISIIFNILHSHFNYAPKKINVSSMNMSLYIYIQISNWKYINAQMPLRNSQYPLAIS